MNSIIRVLEPMHTINEHLAESLQTASV